MPSKKVLKKTTTTTTTTKVIKTVKGAKPSSSKPKKDPLFVSTPKNLRLGGDIQVKRDLSRFVRWPRYVRIQRQRKILYQRLKVPPSINQFTNTVDKNTAADLFKLLLKYQPETKAAKTLRLRNIAAGKEEASAPPAVIKYGLNHVTSLIENKKAKLVVIAHDVNPIELVVFLPALCRKFDIPYTIVKGKARLGQLVHKKNAAVVALTHVNKEDKSKFDSLATAFKTKFNDDNVTRRKWGGGIMGLKTQKKLELREKAIAAEAAKKAQY
jgi:large subunit ribosomal protein L7Ae